MFVIGIDVPSIGEKVEQRIVRPGTRIRPNKQKRDQAQIVEKPTEQENNEENIPKDEQIGPTEPLPPPKEEVKESWDAESSSSEEEEVPVEETVKPSIAPQSAKPANKASSSENESDSDESSSDETDSSDSEEEGKKSEAFSRREKALARIQVIINIFPLLNMSVYVSINFHVIIIYFFYNYKFLETKGKCRKGEKSRHIESTSSMRFRSCRYGQNQNFR